MTQTQIPAATLQAACDVLKESYRRGWISTRDGNISVRDPMGGMLAVSPSGAIKHALTPEQLIGLPLLADTDLPQGQQRPSGELSLHRKVQALLPDEYQTVLHVHATYAVAALYAGWSLQKLVKGFPEVCRYTRVGQDVPALPAISEDLAVATEAAFQSPQLPHIVGLDRHGAVAIGRDPWDAFEHVERLEHICQIVLATGAPQRYR